MNTLLAIDISNSKIVSVIAKNDITDKTNILGVGIEKSKGIEKGNIINIEAAANSIKKSVESAKHFSDDEIDQVYVTISGSFAKNIKTTATANVPSGQITRKEIYLVMQTAISNANISTDFDVIHAIPITFKVDDSENIEDPLSMIGSRLEVIMHVITAKKSYLNNIKNAVKLSGYDVNNFVLNSYASAFSLVEDLDEEKKKSGYLVIDFGSTSTSIAIFKGKSIIHNDFIPVGSDHITRDLSIMLNTPISAAEAVKIKYGTLLQPQDGIEKIKIPKNNDESNSSEISIEYIISILQARIEETLIILRDNLDKNQMSHHFKSGIILTGGTSNIKGIRELCFKIFSDKMVKVDYPANIKNDFLNFEEPIYSTTMGLVKYALNPNPYYELDSSKKLRTKEIKQQRQPQPTIIQAGSQSAQPKPTNNGIVMDDTKLKPKKKSFFGKLKELIEGHL